MNRMGSVCPHAFICLLNRGEGCGQSLFDCQHCQRNEHLVNRVKVDAPSATALLAKSCGNRCQAFFFCTPYVCSTTRMLSTASARYIQVLLKVLSIVHGPTNQSRKCMRVACRSR